jgi:hypothetical protein
MEYEISGEERLFDESTNPSLLHGSDGAEPPRRSARPQSDPADKRNLQKGEVIPEEEQQQA